MMRSIRTHFLLVAPLLAVAALAGPARGWHDRGHHAATQLAVADATETMPAFFATGAPLIAHCSLDPDAFTRPMAPDELHRAESPEQYMDVELLSNLPAATSRPGDSTRPAGDVLWLPPDRWQFVAWCGSGRLDPSKVGLVPYSVTEWTERLAVALAEHRKWPGNANVRAKCLVYAGNLSHYAEDLCQPLHTTVDYDGRVGPDGKSPRTGIHLKVDALLGKWDSLPGAARGGQADAAKVEPFDELFPAVVAELERSHALVARVYELEPKLPADDEPIRPGGEVAGFTEERMRASTLFTARLYATAWKMSADIEIPEWHDRAALEGGELSRPASQAAAPGADRPVATPPLRRESAK
jgi:hypothetical protein